MQSAKFAAIILNGLSRGHIIASGHFTILKVAPVAPVNIDYLPAEYRLIPSGNDWDPDSLVPREVLNIYMSTPLNTIMGLEAVSTLGN